MAAAGSDVSLGESLEAVATMVREGSLQPNQVQALAQLAAGVAIAGDELPSEDTIAGLCKLGNIALDFDNRGMMQLANLGKLESSEIQALMSTLKL